MTDRQLWDLEAEGMLLGWMLVKAPEQWGPITDVLAVEDFAHPPVAQAYATLLSQGYVAIPDLAVRCPSVTVNDLEHWYLDAQFRDPVEIRSHAMRLADMAVCRRVESTVREALREAYDPTIPAAELIVRLRDRAFAIELPEALPLESAPTLREFLAQTDDEYDWLIPYLIERGERILVTATGGVGKSTMLRQVAVCAAAGRNPFLITEKLDRPLNVLLVDLENAERHVRRKLRPIARAVGAENIENLRVLAHPDIIDVTKPEGWKFLYSYAKEAQPDLIVLGPVYRLYEAGDTARDTGGRDKARQVVHVLDGVRDRFKCALMMEAHPPKGSLTLSPFGSAVWEWWPDVGLGLQPDKERPGVVDVTRWRFDRDERTGWPKRMEQGGTAGWKPLGYGSGGLHHGIQTGRPPIDQEDGY